MSQESAIKLQSTRQEADGRKKIEIQEKSCRCLYSVKLFTLSRMKNQFFCMCLTVTLLSAAAQSCSSQCTCAGDLANCKFVSSLQEVLTDLPKSTAMILLQGGSITMIEPRAFQNFSNLWYLSITDFKLSLLSNAFTMSTTEESSLQLLDLSNNRLENCRVESSAFAGLQNLTELKLNENSLNVLKPAWFSDLTSLNKLNIKLNNISYLPPRIFATLTQLNQLNAASNLIQYLSTDTFYGLSTLNELDLSNNELLFINKDTFRPLQRLSQLLLNDNQLMMLAEVPESVQNLHLQSNPWECSCHLVLLLESRREAIQDPGNLFCQSPENVKGKPVLNLSSSYCSSATLLPATTPLSLTASALQVIPTLSVRAAVYGFIVGFLLAGAICLIICCRKYWREGLLRIHAVHSNETKRREGTKRQSEPFVELRASKLEAGSVIASHLIVDGLQNIKDNHEEQRKQHLKVSTESWKNRKRESGENAVKKTEAMRPCKAAPNSLHATDVPHLQNKGVDSVTSMTMECGKAGSWENAEIVTLKHCEIEQMAQSKNCLTNLYMSQHHLCSREESQYLGDKVNFPERLLTNGNNPAGNMLSVSTNTNQPLRNDSGEVHVPQTEDRDSSSTNSLSVLYGEAVSSPWEFKSKNLEKIRTLDSRDTKTENLGRSEAKVFYKERNEMVEEAEYQLPCNPVKVTGLNESSSSVGDCTGEMNGRVLWDPINPIGSKLGTHGTAIHRYSNVAAISIGWELQSSILSNGNGDTQLPDVEDRTCSILFHSPSSNSFGKQKPKLINKSISLPNMKTFICGIQHRTKKRSQDKLICSRTPELVNVKPAPNAKSASMEEWSNMNKEIVHETFGHRLPDVQTCVELEYSSRSKPKCEPQKLMQDGIPCKANLLEEEGTTFKPPKSQNEDEENNTLQLLEVNGSLDDKYSQWQQTSPGNFQLSSSVGLQMDNRLHVSQVALSGTSHQQASHFSLCAHYCEQPRFNLSHKSTFQQDDEDQSETCQFTSGHKLVAATEFNVFDAIDGEDNTLSAITRENISPPDILDFAHDECKKPEHISPDTQKSATDILEQVLSQMETPVNKDFAFMDETHQSNENKSELSNSVTTETILFVGGSAVPVDGGITTDSIITEDEMSQDGTASTSFSWPYAWSMQSQENWNQSPTTFESAPVSEDSETNLSQKVTSKDDIPGQRGTRTVHRQNNLGVEEHANRSEATSFQNVSYRNDVSINGESNLELEGHIQSPIMADLEKFSYINNAEIRKDSNLDIDHCGHIPNYSKKIYKSVFKIIDEMRHPVPLDKVQHKMLQNSPALGVEANKALIKTGNISIPLSPDKDIESLQQFEASGSACESSVYSRWFYKSEFGNKFVKRIPTAVPEGDDSNTLPNVQCRNTSRSSAQNQTRSEDDEGPADVGAREDAHKLPQFLQLNPPTREELLADDELMLINVLYNLKTALDFE